MATHAQEVTPVTRPTVLAPLSGWKTSNIETLFSRMCQCQLNVLLVKLTNKTNADTVNWNQFEYLCTFSCLTDYMSELQRQNSAAAAVVRCDVCRVTWYVKIESRCISFAFYRG